MALADAGDGKPSPPIRVASPVKLRALLPSLLIACGPTLEPPATVAIPPLGQDGPAPSASTSRSGSEAWLRSLPCDGWATVGAITRTPSGDILVLGTCSPEETCDYPGIDLLAHVAESRAWYATRDGRVLKEF